MFCILAIRLASLLVKLLSTLCSACQYSSGLSRLIFDLDFFFDLIAELIVVESKLLFVLLLDFASVLLFELRGVSLALFLGVGVVVLLVGVRVDVGVSVAVSLTPTLAPTFGFKTLV